MAASIKCDERPFKGGAGLPQPKTGGSGGQRPQPKLFFFVSSFSKDSPSKLTQGQLERLSNSNGYKILVLGDTENTELLEGMVQNSQY